MQELQIYFENQQWKSGDSLVKAEVVSKEQAHERDLLHLSAHLLIINQEKQILSRRRKRDDFRYADMWTSTIGTHVLLGDDYLTTLLPLLPLKKDLEFIGEFRVHDEYENEINGLYVMEANVEDLPTEFLSDKKFFSPADLQQEVDNNHTTPHLKGAFELLLRGGYQK